jgi:hypothetical protein
MNHLQIYKGKINYERSNPLENLDLRRLVGYAF